MQFSQDQLNNADGGYLTFRSAYVLSHNGTGHDDDLIVIRPTGRPHSRQCRFV